MGKTDLLAVDPCLNNLHGLLQRLEIAVVLVLFGLPLPLPFPLLARSRFAVLLALFQLLLDDLRLCSYLRAAARQRIADQRQKLLSRPSLEPLCADRLVAAASSTHSHVDGGEK